MNIEEKYSSSSASSVIVHDNPRVILSRLEMIDDNNNLNSLNNTKIPSSPSVLSAINIHNNNNNHDQPIQSSSSSSISNFLIEKYHSSFGKPAPLTQQIIASTFGSCLTAVFTCPLDVIKSRLQTQSNSHQLHTKHHHLPQSTFRGLLSIVKHEGIATLWRGLRPTLLMTIPNNGIYYSLYEKFKVQFKDYGHTFTPLISGCVARIIAVTVTNPIEYFKTASQVSKTKIYLRDLRWDQLLRGYSATLLRDVPFSSLYWMFYENLKYNLLIATNKDCKARLSSGDDVKCSNLILISFLSGAIGGVFATTLTHPFDVIKTNAQNVNSNHVGVFDISRSIYKSQGMKGFSRGLMPRCLKVAPSCAIMISTYELIKHMFNS